MEWEIKEAAAYYRSQGAPGDQTALIALLREVQEESGGAIQVSTLGILCAELGTRESYLKAVIHRIPSLRLSGTHVLELCAGPNCSKRGRLAAFVEQTYGKNPQGFTLRYTGCLRMCGKGPNLKWDGQVYNQATEELIRQLVEGKK